LNLTTVDLNLTGVRFHSTEALAAINLASAGGSLVTLRHLPA
jgi:hypothetical protein